MRVQTVRASVSETNSEALIANKAAKRYIIGFPSLVSYCAASVMIPGSKNKPAFVKAGIRFSDAIEEG
jgi:hypothetical protein